MSKTESVEAQKPQRHITKLNNIYKNLQLPELEHLNEFIEYCEWSAFPVAERKPKTRKELARKLGVSAQTLVTWSKIPEYNFNIRTIVKVLIGNELPELINVLKHKAIKERDNKAIELTLKWLGELQDTATIHADSINISWDK